MIIKNLEVNEIAVTKVDSKNKKVQLKVNFTNDSPMIIDLDIQDNFDLVIDKILKQIKSIKKGVDRDEDEILGGISIVNINNEEDLKERLPKRFFLIDRRFENIKQTTNYKEYMNQYTQLSTFEEVIYKR